MIYGIGTDICAINRVERALSEHGERFVKRLLTPQEQSAFSAAPTPEQLAKRWAAKEATSKALGVGIGAKLSFQDISISHDSSGKPLLHVTNDAFSPLNYHVSLSDEADYAIAFVVAESV